ncbi:MAG: hypothetical protein TREMPRED_002607, partial [Tremellales sp. Tagirdzhanova-0007]
GPAFSVISTCLTHSFGFEELSPHTILLFSPTMPKHFLLFSATTWGHTRPPISLAAKLISLSSEHYVTLIVSTVQRHNVMREISFYDVDTDRLHVLCLGTETKTEGYVSAAEIAASYVMMIDQFNYVFPRVMKCESLRDDYLKEDVPSFTTVPSVAIVDLTITPVVIESCRKIAAEVQAECTFLAFCPLSTPYGLWSGAWEAAGDYVGLLERYEKITAAGEDKYDEMLDKEIMKNEDRIEVPGLAPTYVFETCPNAPDMFLRYMGPIAKGTTKWDGIIFAWPAFMGKDYKEYCEHRHFPSYLIGPLQPSFTGRGQAHITFGGKREELVISEFLDKAVTEEGRRCVLYISFGTLFWPPSVLQAQVFLDVLVELGIRFVLVQGQATSDHVSVAEEKIRQSGGKGIMVRWAPQNAILNHPGTGCFLTHGGSNSTLEAIRLKVPLIFWPGSADQTQTANALTHIYDVGIELLQVRNGYNIGRRTALGVLVENTKDSLTKEFREIFHGMMRGKMGERKRDNMEKLADQMREDSDSGLSQKEMLRLVAA